MSAFKIVLSDFQTRTQSELSSVARMDQFIRRYGVDFQFVGVSKNAYEFRSLSQAVPENTWLARRDRKLRRWAEAFHAAGWTVLDEARANQRADATRLPS